MKKLVGIVLLASLLVPWPLVLAAPIRSRLQGVVPPEEIEFAAPLLGGFIAYPAIALIALLTLGTMISREKRRERTQARGMVTPGHGPLAPPMEAERRRRRREAQRGGDIAMSLMLLEDNKKKK